AIPFASTDWNNIRTFVEQVDRAFLPRPQGAQAAIAVGNRHPEISLPAAFEAFRQIEKNSSLNMASTVQLSATREMTIDEVIAARDGENPTAAGHTRVSITHLYHAGLWAAIRAGWRKGYNAEADHVIITGNTPAEIEASIVAGKLAIERAAGFTKFTTDTSRMFQLRADPRHPSPWTEAELAAKFEEALNADERAWVLAEFSRPFAIGGREYLFSPEDIIRHAVKFGESLKVNEDLYDHIRTVKTAFGTGRSFDFEPSLDEADTLTTPRELIFYMHWLKSRGRPAQLVPPNLGFKKRQAYPETAEALEKYSHHKMWPELLPAVRDTFGGDSLAELGARVSELADVARHFDGTLSIHSGSGKQAAVLDQIGRATAGRVNYKISGELQLQLLDVLSEQPAGSYWRGIFERMCERTNAFAAKGAFGEESALAGPYMQECGMYLGNAPRGRVDGNLFLVFWVGNLVGSRDVAAPDGDTRFFKEKLDELPDDLLAEVRRRNAAYIVWLADHLRG
ncbi:MAG: tagaturonate epimerase family protein, partial [Acidobacteria bacterium]|nr:tagaturonate epimerase family protein [Acidobacteriota bacterium]